MENWKPVVGYGGRYEVSDYGRVNSIKNGLLKQSRSGEKSNYLVVTLTVDGFAKQYRVHRLVLDAFVGLCPEGSVGCHNDGDTINNHLSNLRWDTQKSNCADRMKHGTALIGERNPKAFLTETKVKEIRSRIASGEKSRLIRNDHGISRQLYYRIKHNLIWRHL